MSKAFTREDVDPPERSGRKRSPSGLPPGAVNYITARGARRLRAELATLRGSGQKSGRIIELEEILGSIQIVEPPDNPAKDVAFGSTITVEDANGAREICTVVGVDELSFEPDAVSWISPNGKALLTSELGGRLTFVDGRTVRVVGTQYRMDAATETGSG